jgi:Winged helix-turn helix
MKGCTPAEYQLRASDRRYLHEIVRDGSQLQRVARRAHILLALDRGERIVEIMRWLGVSRMGVWHVWQRYQQRGVSAIVDEDRSGRPVVFSPAGASANRADRVY